VRSEILRCARELRESKLAEVRRSGSTLLKLVDDQAVHNMISWPDLIEQTSGVVRECQLILLKGVEQVKKSWLDAD
jgi:hypothetical protein